MNQTVLITGASSGLGADFIPHFISDGYHVILTARSYEKMQQLTQDYNPESYTIIIQDLQIPHAAAQLYEKVKQRGLTIDILINNAGFGLLGDFHTLDLQQQLAMMQVNMTSLVELTYLCLGDMENKQAGKILNVASVAAYLPGPKMAIYYATKAFVLSFSQALCEEYANTPIQISILAPGATKTNFAKVAHVEKTKMFARPMKSSVVVSIAYHQFMKGKHIIIPGTINKLIIGATKILPRHLLAKVAKTITRI
ncbi:MAG: SDR family NAD(P)-dependent oxidoreductase [Culicoidibacterales bacterium]